MQIHPGVKKLHNALEQHIPQGSSLIVAVSGGADSLALADGISTLAAAGYCRAQVVHVEHGLRGAESLADAALVKDFCAARMLNFTCVQVKVKEYAQADGLSTEEAARKLRYAALLEQLELQQADFIVTAHQSDDQAETVLLKLLRGTGLAGLRGMQVRSGKILRPLLHLTRTDLERYCQLQGITYCTDSTNEDTAYTRNRIRKELLPYLEQHFNPAVRTALVQTAQLLQDDEACLAQLTEEKFAALVSCSEGTVTVNVRQWAALPKAIRTRLLRQCYFAIGGKELAYRHTEALDVLCLRGTSGKYIQLPQKITAYYKRGKLNIYLNDKGAYDDEGRY